MAGRALRIHREYPPAQAKIGTALCSRLSTTSSGRHVKIITFNVATLTPRQWQSAWRIFNAAVELPPSQQRPFVESESEDPEIARQVFEMLAEQPDAESPKAAPVNRPGTHVGRYRVEGFLGRGGMGEVYTARDTLLDRPVALKFLLPQAIGNPDAVKRFVREAKAASALNHPHIVTIHEVIDSDAGLAIAMELVDGKPLSELRGAAAPVSQWTAIGRQVAAALAAAHEHGIAHRDIKPENLILRPDGFVKVLDFGLARIIGGKTEGSRVSVTAAPSGTLRYMSPEQLRGEAVTGASDVFSLGLVLYELAAGVHPFDAAYAWETAHAIHTRDAAAPSTVNREVPEALDELIVSMLNRKAAQRPTAAEVAVRLSVNPTPARVGRFGKWALWAAAGAGAAAAVWSGRDLLMPAKSRLVEFTRYPGDEDMPTLSPDGQSAAFVWNGPAQNNLDIYVRRIESGPLERITTDPLEDFSPAWSPVDATIAFLKKAPNTGNAGVYLVSPNGGTERKIADISLVRFDAAPSLTWTPDGKFLIAPSRETERDSVGLFLISPADGSKVRLTRPPLDQSDRAPAVSPDGRSLAFARSISESVYTIYLLPLSRSFLAAGEPQPLPSFPNLRVGTPQWTWNGKELLFAANPQSGMTIWRIPVPAIGEAPKPPRRESYAEPGFRIRVGRPSEAAHRLIYSTEIQERRVWRVPLGPAGGSKPQRLNTLGESNFSARISPDGSRIAFDSMRTGSTEIWIANADGTGARALTNFGGPVTGSPAWSPDGRRIAFDSRAEGRPHIYVIPAAGGRPERVTQALAENFLPSWSHDGRWLYFCSSRLGSVEVWRQPDGGGEAIQLTRQGGFAPVESPDGSFLYYQRMAVPVGWSLRRLALGSGEDVELLNATSERTFEIAPGGIYYVPASTDGRFTIQYYDFETRTSRLVARILRPLPRRMALAPDGSFLLYSQLDRFGLDLMLIENFR